MPEAAGRASRSLFPENLRREEPVFDQPPGQATSARAGAPLIPPTPKGHTGWE